MRFNIKLAEVVKVVFKELTYANPYFTIPGIEGLYERIPCLITALGRKYNAVRISSRGFKIEYIEEHVLVRVVEPTEISIQAKEL